MVDEEDADRGSGCRPEPRSRRAARAPSPAGRSIGMTGRERIVSTIVASTCSAPSSDPERTASRSRSWAAGIADQALPGPGERVGGRLVAGENQGQELVAQLVVAQRLAVLGPRLQQQREDVAPLAEVPDARRRGDHRVGGPVEELEPDPGQARPPRRGRGSSARRSAPPAWSRPPPCASSRIAASTRGCHDAGLPSMPKIPAMITSRVIACIRGASANGRPTGQPSISRSAAVGDRPACSARSPRRGRGAAAACAGACGAGRARSAPSCDRRSARSGDSPVSDGASSGFAVKSERT